MSKTKTNDDTNVVVVDKPNVVETRDTKNDVDKSKKTFKLAQLARELGHNEKHVRARFRRIYDHKNDVLLIDDDTTRVVRERRVKNAKTCWVFYIDAIDKIASLIKRDDDE